MAEPAHRLEPHDDIPLPDVSHLITEDDTPVDNFFQDKQAKILTDALDASWPQGRPFVSGADVAIYSTNQETAVVPDMLLSTGVSFPEQILEKDKRCYYVWLFGKPPEVVVELVSNSRGEEDGEKLERYARIKVPYYVIYDPHHLLSTRSLRIRQLSGASYVDKLDGWFPELGLGLCVWNGNYDGMEANWLRWCDQEGQPLATGLEKAEVEGKRADRERDRADREQQRADEAQRKRQVLEAKLRELGNRP